MKEVIEDTVQEVIDYFDSLDFVKNWYSRHDKWTDWHDEADKIQAFLFLLRNFKLYRTEKLWDLAMQAKDYFVKDDLLAAAPQEYLHLDCQHPLRGLWPYPRPPGLAGPQLPGHP